MMLASAGPSPGQTCGLVLIFAVLVQAISVAITFLYFTNELQQEVVPLPWVKTKWWRERCSTYIETVKRTSF